MYFQLYNFLLYNFQLILARTVAVTVAMGEQVLFEKGHKDNTFFRVVEMMELKSKTINTLMRS